MVTDLVDALVLALFVFGGAVVWLVINEYSTGH
jgi:hypothetical protein